MPAPRVLVVEDDAGLGDLLRRGLDEEGFAVRTWPAEATRWPPPLGSLRTS